MSASILLGRSHLRAIVDDDMLPAVSAYQWSAQRADQTNENFYAYAQVDNRKVYLHRFVLRPPQGVLVDHKNSNGLDNRRDNLRPATKSQNNVNRRATNKTGFKGVERDEVGNRFRASLYLGPARRIRLGSFRTAVEAAIAFDEAALAHWGEFARLNFPRATVEAGAAQ